MGRLSQEPSVYLNETFFVVVPDGNEVTSGDALVARENSHQLWR